MSDRTFRLIFDGKKGGLVKGSSPSSAAKKACKKLSAETGKTSFKFELQETTKDSKKKVYGPYKIKVKMVGGDPGNNKKDNKEYTENELAEFYNKFIKLNQVDNGYKWSNKFYSRYSELAKKILKKENPELNEVKNFFITKFSANPMVGGVNPFSVLSKNSNTKNTSLPPFEINNSNDSPNHVNLSYNFSAVNKSDLTKQLSTLIKIKQRIQKLHDEFSKALSNKRSSQSPKNITSLPKLRTNKLNKSDINFANYNLQESLARGDVEQKFYELSHFYEKINNLIKHIQETLRN